MNLHDLPVHALSDGLKARRFSPVDVVEACLGRIETLEPKLRAFVHVHGKEARLAAEAAALARAALLIQDCTDEETGGLLPLADFSSS